MGGLAFVTVNLLERDTGWGGVGMDLNLDQMTTEPAPDPTLRDFLSICHT